MSLKFNKDGKVIVPEVKKPETKLEKRRRIKLYRERRILELTEKHKNAPNNYKFRRLDYSIIHNFVTY